MSNLSLYLIRKNKAGIVGTGTAIALSAGALFLMGGSPKEEVAPALATVPEINSETIVQPKPQVQEPSTEELGEAKGEVVTVSAPEVKVETQIVEAPPRSTTTLAMRLAKDGKRAIEQGKTSKWSAKIWESVNNLRNPLPQRFNGIERTSYDLIVKLKEWCDSESKLMDDVTDYNTYSHFCADEFSTVGGHLISNGFLELSDGDNVSRYSQHSNNQKFRNQLVEYSDMDVGSENRQSGAQQLKHMCYKWLREQPVKPLDAESLNHAKQWCGKMPGSNFSGR